VYYLTHTHTHAHAHKAYVGVKTYYINTLHNFGSINEAVSYVFMVLCIADLY